MKTESNPSPVQRL